MVDYRVSFSVESGIGKTMSDRKQISYIIAERLAMSIMLQRLKVSVVKINGQEFNLNEIRNRDRRF